MAQGSEPSVYTTVGYYGAWLRLGDQGIAYRNLLRTHWIGWDQVRFFTDGSWGEDGKWVLRIVLRDGGVIQAAATLRDEARPETLAAIRQAAARHAVPAVLTGTPLKQGQPHRAGLYVDPGGKPGLREWTGTKWSPFLHVDPASSGPDGGNGQARVWSPLPGPEQQRQWDAAARRARRWEIEFAAFLGATAVAGAVMLGVFVYDLGQPKAGLSWAWAGLLVLGLFGGTGTYAAWIRRKESRKAVQAAKKAAELARAEDTTASPLDDQGDPAAGAPVTGQPPAADPAVPR
jgi:hypothetical protein